MQSFNRKQYEKTLELINSHNLNTVCLSANCPNKFECFSRKTATFMILGDTCSRNCLYCGIKKGNPEKVDVNEPERIANAVKKLGINYAVVTCVTRDDLQDGGASQFVKVAKLLKKQGCNVELLISDLNGNWSALQDVIDAKPEVINHNIEVVRPLFSKLRPSGNYDLSLKLLQLVKRSGVKTKSGFMVGFGESMKDVVSTLQDLKNAGVDVVTIGQYLAPSDKHFKVVKFYSDNEFEQMRAEGEKLGIKVVAGKLVRSSYNAESLF